MNIVIFGAGTVGTSIAEILCENQHNVCVVDVSREVLDVIEEKLDIQTVCGSACDAITLFQAGVITADLCLAVTTHDEINLVGASLAKAMGASRSVARIFETRYTDTSTFDYKRHFNINHLLSLELLTAVELAKQVRSRGAFSIENFVRGEIEVQEIAVEKSSKAVGISLKDLNLPKGVRVGLISSGNQTIIPGADDAIKAGDHVSLIGTRDTIESVKKKFEHKAPPRLNIVIAGGGEIGYHLAGILQTGRFNVSLMESNEKRCEYLAGKLDNVTVLHADITRVSEMEEARVGKADVFIAATGRDEDNIVCGVEARELGCQRIMSIVRRPDYANVLAKLGIDVSVSPREVMAKQVLGLVETGPIQARSSLFDGDAEIWEVEVLENSPITKAPLKDIPLQQCLVAALERETYVKVPGGEDQVQAGDNVILLVGKDFTDKSLEFITAVKDS
jgi:trk/ktr system potassium uptake protein